MSYSRFPLLFSTCLALTWSACKSGDKDLTLEAAINSFQLAEGFEISLVVSEPIISDPVDMIIDEEGRMFVVEMHGYPMDVSGSGKIILLEDSNGDGDYDRHGVFADNLVLPTGITRWKKGVLVTDPPHLLYLEDSNGDGKADIRTPVLSGFARSNPQHNVNSPRLAMDNWIYLGHEPAVTTIQYADLFGDTGSEVHFPDFPEGPKLPVNAGGRGIRLKPDHKALELLSSRTQFGHTWDAFGQRFLVNNNNHIIHEVFKAEYLDRNPHFPISGTTQSISDHGNAAEVFSITDNPEHQLLTDIGVMTSACGPLTYLGGSFPEPYEGAVFVAEPVSNLVHVDILSENGATFTASRLFEDKEFLASRDSWFRPVNFYVGPDGALYVVDYYRQYIEHPEWMADEIVEAGGLYNGADKGRIYKITPKGEKKATSKPNISQLSSRELAEMLGHANSWWRQNAQRLLVDRKDEEALETLMALASQENDPISRVHALWTLEGLGKLNPEILEGALHDKHPGVRVNIIKLIETHRDKFPDLVQQLMSMAQDPDPKVRFQLVNTLGFENGEIAKEIRLELLKRDLEEEWVHIAALSAKHSDPSAYLELIRKSAEEHPEASASLAQKVGKMVGLRKVEKESKEAIHLATTPPTSEKDRLWQGKLLQGLAETASTAFLANTLKEADKEKLLELAFSDREIPIREACHSLFLKSGGKLSEAYQKKAFIAASDQQKSGEERALFIRLLEGDFLRGVQDTLLTWINPNSPLPLQLAVLQTLDKGASKGWSSYLLNKWNTLTPPIREAALDRWLANREGILLILDNLENGPLQASHLGWPRSVRLMNQKDQDLKSRARELLAGQEEAREAAIAEYQQVLSLKGSISKGEKVYDRNCAVCHQMGKDRGIAFGPDLASLRNRQKINLLSDILDPDLSIADGYDLWMVKMQDGASHQGLIHAETPVAIELKQVGGQTTTLARKDILELNVSAASAMPGGWEQQISQQEMADLLAFIKQIE
ncbi:PVC-type heme-binding CxxCH protein [Pleomorphovibrio marinus]|uniref:PVC-type heme-binding CxxCH protein n=1 Tax=Pleomorphovibrio marinus TaxID=2164132 RepID=UPI000E0BBCD8|nr:PVC-type heme-binding CxxCH protein [Pleomorphovibrio marinus]